MNSSLIASCSVWLLLLASPFMSNIITAVTGCLAVLIVARERKNVILPGALILIWQYVNYIIMPSLDDRVWYEPQELLFPAIFCVVSHALYDVVTGSMRDSSRSRLIEDVMGIENRYFYALFFIALFSVIYLLAVGAFAHTAGKNVVSAHGKGIAGTLKTLFYPAVAMLAVGLPHGISGKSRTLLTTVAFACGLAASFSSGRKEEFALTLGIYVLFRFASQSALSSRAFVSWALACILALSFLFTMNQIRKHYFFFTPGYNATMADVLMDVLDGRNVADSYEYSIISRLNHLEPTRKYFNSGIQIVSYDEALTIVKHTITPGALKDNFESAYSHFGFIVGVRLGYARYFGDASISIGPVAEAHNFLGWFGVALVCFVPIIINAILFSVHRTRLFLPVFWLVVYRCTTYERPFLDFLCIAMVWLPIMFILVLFMDHWTRHSHNKPISYHRHAR